MAHPTIAGIGQRTGGKASAWWRQYKAKRLVDLILALILLVALAPCLCVMALAIKLDGPGPVVYRQRRIGFEDRPFDVLKFRTMRTDRDLTHLVSQSARDDPRVTRVGALLRRTSLDELPQLFQILNGDMTFVGPRPQLDADVSFFKAVGAEVGDHLVATWWRARRSLPPGLITPTKLAGYRGSESSVNRLARLIEIEIDYVKQRSFWSDISAMTKAVIMVVRAENAY